MEDRQYQFGIFYHWILDLKERKNFYIIMLYWKCSVCVHKTYTTVPEIFSVSKEICSLVRPLNGSIYVRWQIPVINVSRVYPPNWGFSGWIKLPVIASLIKLKFFVKSIWKKSVKLTNILTTLNYSEPISRNILYPRVKDPIFHNY